MRVAVVGVMLGELNVETDGIDTVVVSVLENAVAAHHLIARRREFPAGRWELGVGEEQSH